MRITGSDRPAAPSGEPEWVASLRAEDERRLRAEMDRQMSAPPGAGETLFFGGFMLAVVALGLVGVAAPLRAMRRWQGGWRQAAAVPAAIVAFVVLRIVFDTGAG